MIGGGAQPRGANRFHNPDPSGPRAGFSLIEMVIVVTIISILAVIALPRLGSLALRADANGEDFDRTNLLRAIEMYRQEHGVYPSGANLKWQLIRFTDESGAVSPTMSSRYRFGPYLRTAPATYASTTSGAVLLEKSNENAAKWLYIEAEGSVVANPKGKSN